MCELYNDPKYWNLGNPEEKAVYIFLKNETYLYRKLNMALIEDSNTKLQIYMPLIRGINKYLTKIIIIQPLTVYRGAWLPQKYLKYFIKYGVLRIPTIWSCNTNKQVTQTQHFFFCVYFYLSALFVFVAVYCCHLCFFCFFWIFCLFFLVCVFCCATAYNNKRLYFFVCLFFVTVIVFIDFLFLFFAILRNVKPYYFV